MPSNPYYVRLTDFIPDTSVRSDDLDQELNGVVGGFDLLGDPTKIGNGGLMIGTDSGTADNYVYDNGLGATAPIDGQLLSFVPGNTSTGASVISYNTLDNVDVVRNDGTASGPGDFVDGVPTMLIYDLANDRWVFVGATAAQVKESFRPSVSEQTGTTYTIVGTDENSMITFTNASAVTITAPSDATENLPIGFIVHLHQEAAGQITIAPDTGVTLDYAYSLSARTQYSALSLMKTGANEYKVIGDIG